VIFLAITSDGTAVLIPNALKEERASLSQHEGETLLLEVVDEGPEGGGKEAARYILVAAEDAAQTVTKDHMI